MSTHPGQCLCGAVQIRIGAHDAAVSVCHCSLCQRWTGFALAVFRAPADQVRVSGPVRTYRASTFAERAFCETCGSHLWMRDDDGDYDLVPAIFDAASDWPLDHEIYADHALASARLAGDHPRGSASDYEAANRHVAEVG